MSILEASYTIARMIHPTCGWLATATPNVWEQHVKYLLGPDVYGFAILHKGTAVRSERKLPLIYEQQIRRRAIERVLYEGQDFGSAMLAARKDQELRNTCFVAPATTTILSNVTENSLAALAGGGPPIRREREQRGGPYSKGAGQGKNRGNKGKAVTPPSQKPQQSWQTQYDLKRTTPDGKAICFAYNNNGERCPGSCGREHVCQICFGKHPGHVHHKASDRGPGGGKASS